TMARSDGRLPELDVGYFWIWTILVINRKSGLLSDQSTQKVSKKTYELSKPLVPGALKVICFRNHVSCLMSLKCQNSADARKHQHEHVQPPNISRKVLQRPCAAFARYEQLRETRKRPIEAEDGFQKLPADWQAIYWAAPEFNAKADFEEFAERQKRLKRRKEKDSSETTRWEGRPGESLEQQIARLQSEVTQLHKEAKEKQKVQEEWAKKVAEARALRKEGEDLSRRVLQEFETASYDHAVARGQLRSSDMYFQFLTQDTQDNGKLQVSTLERSCALMDKTMDLLKGHIRTLHEVQHVSASYELEPTPGLSPGLSPGPGLTPLTPRTPMTAAVKLRALKVPPTSPSLRD
ncbi:unnamed protein product, partial [Effrenium voratum]